MKATHTPISNYIPLGRGIINHWLWKERRPRTRAEAWIWMIMTAKFDIKPEKELIGGKLLQWGRGQFPGSLRFLAEVWKWKSTGKVQRFLGELMDDDMISIEIVNGQQIITITNYGKFNFISVDKRAVNEHSKHYTERDGETLHSKPVSGNRYNEISTPNVTPNGTEVGQGWSNIKNVNKENNEERVHAQNILEKSNLFRKTIIPTKIEVLEVFIQNGGTKEMVKAFYDRNESTGWLYKGSPIVNFGSLVYSFVENWKKNDRGKLLKLIQRH